MSIESDLKEERNTSHYCSTNHETIYYTGKFYNCPLCRIKKILESYDFPDKQAKELEEIFPILKKG